MDIQDFRDVYVDQATDLLQKLDLNEPEKSVIKTQDSLTAMLENFIKTQSATTSSLINFIGSACTENRQINGNELTPNQQKQVLSELASRQNLMCRQLEKGLNDHLNIQLGKKVESDQHLVNEFPNEVFGQEVKISDSSLRLITPFSGDETNSEADLTTFLREIYNVSQTNNLNESTTINILVRKLTGTAQILVDDFIAQNDRQNMRLKQVVAHLERKFLMVSSPYVADTRLHEIKIMDLSYSQLHAQITRLAKLATRLEPKEKKETLVRIKENSAFLNAINSEDRKIITAENVRRESEYLSPMNIDQMSNLLTQRSADKLSSSEVIFKATETSRPNVTPQSDEIIDLAAPPAPPQPAGRGRGQGFRGGFRGRGARGRGKFAGNASRRWVTALQAGVDEHTCLLCGDPSHTFKDKKCKYHGQRLMPSKCKKCYKGAHPTAVCLA